MHILTIISNHYDYNYFSENSNEIEKMLQFIKSTLNEYIIMKRMDFSIPNYQ